VREHTLVLPRGMRCGIVLVSPLMPLTAIGPNCFQISVAVAVKSRSTTSK